MGHGESAAATHVSVTQRRSFRLSPERGQTCPKTKSREATSNGVDASGGSFVMTSRYVWSASAIRSSRQWDLVARLRQSQRDTYRIAPRRRPTKEGEGFLEP